MNKIVILKESLRAWPFSAQAQCSALKRFLRNDMLLNLQVFFRLLFALGHGGAFDMFVVAPSGAKGTEARNNLCRLTQSLHQQELLA
ncbi:MAG: hypothetical protein ONB44_22675 [candidate division KSB1 bacterium]|nr:hypothetical protein [candidate division KSB1 bacterium]